MIGKLIVEGIVRQALEDRGHAPEVGLRSPAGEYTVSWLQRRFGEGKNISLADACNVARAAVCWAERAEAVSESCQTDLRG